MRQDYRTSLARRQMMSFSSSKQDQLGSLFALVCVIDGTVFSSLLDGVYATISVREICPILNELIALKCD